MINYVPQHFTRSIKKICNCLSFAISVGSVYRRYQFIAKPRYLPLSVLTSRHFHAFHSVIEDFIRWIRSGQKFKKFFVSWNTNIKKTVWSGDSELAARTDRLINTECEVTYRFILTRIIKASDLRRELFSNVTQSGDFAYKALLVMMY